MYRAYVMFILVVVYTFNFIDRQIVGILAVPIKADLGLSDTQLGLMGGLAFALFTACNLVPRAVSNHRWYLRQFPDYPPQRRVLLPGLF